MSLKYAFLRMKKHCFLSGKAELIKEENQCISKSLRESFLASKFTLAGILVQTEKWHICMRQLSGSC